MSVQGSEDISAPRSEKERSELRPEPLAVRFRIALWTYSAIFCLFIVIPILFKYDGSNGLHAFTDFAVYYTTAEMTWDGDLAGAYDSSRLILYERALFPDYQRMSQFYYPPSYVLLLIWLPALPYTIAQIIFVLGTFLVFVAAIRPILSDSDDLVIVLAAPAVWINIAHGQNAFLTAALALFASRWIGTRQGRAGLALGLLSIKPHLCVLWPIYLMARRRWTAICSGAAITAIMIALSLVLFGHAPWERFFQAGLSRAFDSISQTALKQSWIASPYAGLTFLGVPDDVSLAIHALFAVGMAALLIGLIAVGSPKRFVTAFLLAASLFVTPYNYPYDWVFVLAALLIVWREARVSGFLRYEFGFLLLGYFSPLLIVFAEGFDIPIGAVFLLAAIAAIARRGFAEALRV